MDNPKGCVRFDWGDDVLEIVDDVRRHGPLKRVVAILRDRRVRLECGHTVPPTRHTTKAKAPSRMQCCFCPENDRAEWFRENYWRNRGS